MSNTSPQRTALRRSRENDTTTTAVTPASAQTPFTCIVVLRHILSFAAVNAHVFLFTLPQINMSCRETVDSFLDADWQRLFATIASQSGDDDLGGTLVLGRQPQHVDSCVAVARSIAGCVNLNKSWVVANLLRMRAQCSNCSNIIKKVARDGTVTTEKRSPTQQLLTILQSALTHDFHIVLLRKAANDNIFEMACTALTQSRRGELLPRTRLDALITAARQLAIWPPNYPERGLAKQRAKQRLPIVLRAAAEMAPHYMSADGVAGDSASYRAWYSVALPLVGVAASYDFQLLGQRALELLTSLFNSASERMTARARTAAATSNTTTTTTTTITVSSRHGTSITSFAPQPVNLLPSQQELRTLFDDTRRLFRSVVALLQRTKVAHEAQRQQRQQQQEDPVADQQHPRLQHSAGFTSAGKLLLSCLKMLQLLEARQRHNLAFTDEQQKISHLDDLVNALELFPNTDTVEAPILTRLFGFLCGEALNVRRTAGLVHWSTNNMRLWGVVAKIIEDGSYQCFQHALLILEQVLMKDSPLAVIDAAVRNTNLIDALFAAMDDLDVAQRIYHNRYTTAVCGFERLLSLSTATVDFKTILDEKNLKDRLLFDVRQNRDGRGTRDARRVLRTFYPGALGDEQDDEDDDYGDDDDDGEYLEMLDDLDCF